MKQTNYLPLAMLLTSSYLVGGVALAAAKQPNILFIITDDQDKTTLGAYGDKECDTPNLDALAAQGTVFDAAHQMGAWKAGVSTPSRTMVMTGRNVWSAQKIRQNDNKYTSIKGEKNKPQNYGYEPIEGSPEYYSLPALFKRAGYDTFRTCKSGNSFEPANVLFDVRYDRTCRDGNDERGSKWHADYALDYLKQRAAKDESERAPFFMYLGFSHPHDARHGKPELLRKYGAEDVAEPTKIVEGVTPTLPHNWLPERPFENGHHNIRDEKAVYGVMERRDEITIRNELGKEFACIENIDIQIGRVLEALERSGELDNTYIFFTSDHGIAVGKHNLMGKQNLYEHTFSVPFIVKGPNIPVGKRRRANTYHMDILPTLCDIAGIEAPATADGVSFKRVAEGKQEVVRDVVYGAYADTSKPGMRTVKVGDWKLIKYEAPKTNVKYTQLFNLRENPEELLIEHHDPKIIAKIGNKPKANQRNLADDPKYAAKRAEMEAILYKEMERYNDPYRYSDQPAAK